MVSDSYTPSDQQAIALEIRELSMELNVSAGPPNPLLKDSNFNRAIFVLALEDICLFENANDKAMKHMYCMTEACNASMVRSSHLPGNK